MPTVKVTATGKAAHAGNHHAEGANAIWALARFITRTTALHPTVRFARFVGGQSRNTVPDAASVELTSSDEVLASLDLTSDIDGTHLSRS